MEKKKKLIIIVIIIVAVIAFFGMLAGIAYAIVSKEMDGGMSPSKVKIAEKNQALYEAYYNCDISTGLVVKGIELKFGTKMGDADYDNYYMRYNSNKVPTGDKLHEMLGKAYNDELNYDADLIPNADNMVLILATPHIQRGDIMLLKDAPIRKISLHTNELNDDIKFFVGDNEITKSTTYEQIVAMFDEKYQIASQKFALKDGDYPSIEVRYNVPDSNCYVVIEVRCYISTISSEYSYISIEESVFTNDDTETYI